MRPPPMEWGWSFVGSWTDWLLGYVPIADGTSLFEGALAVVLLARLIDAVQDWWRGRLPVHEVERLNEELEAAIGSGRRDTEDRTTVTRPWFPKLRAWLGRFWKPRQRLNRLKNFTSFVEQSVALIWASFYVANLSICAIDPNFGVQRWYFLTAVALPIVWIILMLIVSNGWLGFVRRRIHMSYGEELANDVYLLKGRLSVLEAQLGVDRSRSGK